MSFTKPKTVRSIERRRTSNSLLSELKDISTMSSDIPVTKFVKPGTTVTLPTCARYEGPGYLSSSVEMLIIVIKFGLESFKRAHW